MTSSAEAGSMAISFISHTYPVIVFATCAPHAATTVSTPPETALRDRRGVCQDFAHVMSACLRSMGVAGRYVSGYLRTRPPPGQPRLAGADASHAWAGVWCGEAGWLDLDPTNDMIYADNGQLHLGRTGALTNAEPNRLRGLWAVDTLTGLTVGQVAGVGAGFVEGIAMQHDLGTETLRPLDLHARGEAGHHDHGPQTQTLGVVGHPLSMVARRHGHHPLGAGLRIELGELVAGPTLLE
jgi:hypothetical protein